jgi:protoporphyrinogen oxidase
MLTEMSRKWLIAGGGISGLAAAQSLQANDRDYLLLERCPALGGLTRTTQVEDFCFDYTGHFLHLRRYPSPSQIPYAHLDDQDWETVERKSYFFAGGRLIDAPIQYHLGELPDDLRKECEASYDARPKSEGDITGFRETRRRWRRLSAASRSVRSKDFFRHRMNRKSVMGLRTKVRRLRNTTRPSGIRSAAVSTF